MKIACIATEWYPTGAGGGLEKYAYGMTQALLRSGDSVDLFLTGEGPAGEPHAHAYSIGSSNDPWWKRALNARRAFARNFREPYDVINIHFALNALPLLPFISHRTPRVVHFQGPWAAESRAEGGGALASLVKQAIERFVYRRADRFIVLSGAFRDVLVGYGIERERVSVIPMGVDCDYFRPPLDRRAVRKQLGWPADATVFFTARRLIHRVGLMELIKAAQIVRATNRNFVVKIAGKGPLAAELANAIEVRGLRDCVQLLGFVSEPELARCYQAADVTVVPTQSLEGFGAVISESLASGTPVIVTPVGGMPEAVSALSSELIARSASAHDIAERMSAVLGGTLRLPSEAVCRRHAVDHFHWDVIWKQVRAVFAAV